MHVLLWKYLMLKGELHSKTIFKEVKEGEKIGISTFLLFWLDILFKRNMHLKLNFWKMLYSLVVVVEGKGTGLVVDVERKEQDWS